MAGIQDITGTAGVSYREEYDAAYCFGTKKALLNSGMFRPEWFPGVGKNNKRSVTVTGKDLHAVGFDPLIAEIQIDRSADDSAVFDVQMSYTEKEAARREEIGMKEFRARVYREAAARAEDWIACLPGNSEAFKRNGAKLIERQIEIIFSGIARERGGYSYTKKTVREFEDAINLACNVLRNGAVEYCQFKRNDEVRRLTEDAFSRDACLSLTGHDKSAWVARFLREREQEMPAVEQA